MVRFKGEKHSPLRAQQKIVEELNSKNNANRLNNFNIKDGGLTPYDK